MTLKIGLVGLGFMGTTHYNIYQQLPGVQVVAVADVDPDKRAGDIRKVHGNIGGQTVERYDFSKVDVYADALEMVARPDLDVVDVCCPTPDHARYVVAALDAGKHVFSEKPLCRTREEMRQIAAAARRSQKFFNVGMCVRAWPEYRHAYEQFTAGRFGKLRAAEFRRLSPTVAGNAWENWYMQESRSGGALLDLHLHDCDLVRYFFGRPRAVATRGLRGLVSDRGIDYCRTRYDFGDGTLVTAEGGWAAAPGTPFEMSFQLFCEKATVRFMSEGYKIYWADGKVETPELNVGDLPTGWHQELAYFTQCVREGVPPTRYQDLASVLDSYCMILAEERACDSGEAVTVEYVD